MTYTRFIGQLGVIGLLVWTLILVLTTSLLILLVNFPPTCGKPSTPSDEQVQHFVCTRDEGGTIQRCAFSTVAPPMNSPQPLTAGRTGN